MPLLINSKECEEFLRYNWDKGSLRTQESFYAVYLNHQGKRMFVERIAFGNFSGCDPDIFLIMQQARIIHSSYVVIAHNHPHGSPEPSAKDIEFTKITQSALCAVDIYLIDHIILTYDSYFSFKDAGLLEKLCKIAC